MESMDRLEAEGNPEIVGLSDAICGGHRPLMR